MRLRLNSDILYHCYELLEEQYGVTVVELDDMPFGSKNMGYYIPSGENIIDEWKGIDRLIIINNKLPNYQKLSIAAHELGHDKCEQNNCGCEGPCNELHAHKSGLIDLFEGEMWSSLFFSMQTACLWSWEYRSGYDKEGKYGLASQELFKTDIWKECLLLFDEELYQWILDMGIGDYVLLEATGVDCNNSIAIK